MPDEESFEELFKAARLLLKEGVTGEEEIFPTLAFASLAQVLWPLEEEKKRLVMAWEDPEAWEAFWTFADEEGRLVVPGEGSQAWEAEVEMFAWKHASLKPVRVVDGILLLERLPVYVYVHDPVYVGNGNPESEAGMEIRALREKEVVIAVYRHPRPASPEDVATLYKEALADARLSFDESREPRMESITLEPREDYSLVIVGHTEKTMPTKYGARGERLAAPVYPHPDRICEYYRPLKGSRKRGPGPEADTVIPACVAFCLRSYAKIKSRKEIHRLLNEHVLRETWKSLPEEGYSSSWTNQLWRDVEKVGERLVAASHPLYFSGPEWMITHNKFSPKNLL